MKDIFIVESEQLGIANKIENKLLSLSEDIGILFVSVNIETSFIFNIIIGCKKDVDVNLVEYIAKYFLQEEISKDTKLIIKVRRGINKPFISS